MFQEKGTKWETSLDMDGLTTNGVLIMHPKGCFSDGNAEPGLWREVSIGGAIYSLRISRSAPVKGNSVCLSAVCKRMRYVRRVINKYLKLSRLQIDTHFHCSLVSMLLSEYCRTIPPISLSYEQFFL